VAKTVTSFIKSEIEISDIKQISRHFPFFVLSNTSHSKAQSEPRFVQLKQRILTPLCLTPLCLPSFIKYAEKTIRDDRGKSHNENVLLPLLTDLFHLLLSDGVTPHLWHKVKITPLHKKGPITSPQNYRLLAINGCIYRLFANVVRDLLMDWALAEH